MEEVVRKARGLRDGGAGAGEGVGVGVVRRGEAVESEMKGGEGVAGRAREVDGKQGEVVQKTNKKTNNNNAWAKAFAEL